MVIMKNLALISSNEINIKQYKNTNIMNKTDYLCNHAQQFDIQQLMNDLRMLENIKLTKKLYVKNM